MSALANGAAGHEPEERTPLRRSKKKVYFVRHGNSTYNSWRTRSFTPWSCPPMSGLCIGDPLIMDAALSPKGEGELARLAVQVKELGLDASAELVVTTPLT